MQIVEPASPGKDNALIAICLNQQQQQQRPGNYNVLG